MLANSRSPVCEVFAATTRLALKQSTRSQRIEPFKNAPPPLYARPRGFCIRVSAARSGKPRTGQAWLHLFRKARRPHYEPIGGPRKWQPCQSRATQRDHISRLMWPHLLQRLG